MLNTLPPPVLNRRGIFFTPPVKTLGGFTTKPNPTMTTPTTQFEADNTRLSLDATCDQIVASLTQRLTAAAQQLEQICPPTNHDFLLPVIDPDLAVTSSHWDASNSS